MSFSLSIEMTSGRCRMQINGPVVAEAIEELRQDILTVALHCQDVEIDLSGVSAIDGEGIELMLLAKRLANGRLRFVGHSVAVMSLLDGASCREHA